MAKSLKQAAYDLQDAYHYAREIQGKDGAFEGSLEVQREKASGLMHELSHSVERISDVVLEYGAIWPNINYKNFKEWASRMEKLIVKISKEMGVDPWTGLPL